MSDPQGPPRTTTFRVEGMDCPEEIDALKRAFAGRPGVQDLSFSLVQGTMTVAHDPLALDAIKIVALVKATGMDAAPYEGGKRGPPVGSAVPRGPLPMTVLAAAGTLLGFALSGLPVATVHHTTWPSAIAYVVAIAAAWRYILPKAWSALRGLRLDMNVLMTVAVIGAVGIGEWLEGATVAFLFMLSHLLESWSVTRARRAIRGLMELSPPKARVLDADGSEREMETAQVRVADRVIVKPGEKFPLDGRVVEGATSVDQAPITGESVPVDKQVGDEVFGGTINQDGAVVVEVTKASGETLLDGVVRLIEQAQAQRSPSERFVDQFARYYTPSVVAGAALVCLVPPLAFGAEWAVWFYRALILLVIACPCALVISTPVTIVSGLTAAARNGVLIKGGEFLEQVGKTTVVALDKTGTLTAGRPAVEAVLPADGVSAEAVLEVAAAIEQRSEHPIADAVVLHAERQGIIPRACEAYQALRGKGAKARVDGTEYLLGNHRLLEEEGLCSDDLHRTMLEHEDCRHTVVSLSSTERPMGVILFADALREEAPNAISELRQAGVRTVVMLTGDNAGTARTIAEECGGIEYRAELLPADKINAVRQLQVGGQRVLMVGDGINDAPALAAADVGVAIGIGGTDAALETADIALMTSDLRKLPWLLRHSKRTQTIIVQNITLALTIKALFLALAIPGMANLWMAIAADMGVSLLVTFNGLRLLQRVAEPGGSNP